MIYKTFPAHPELESFVNCYWTLEVPAQKDVQRQRIVPDGCIEMFFILGDDVKRYASADEYIIQPREMVLGQITEPLYIEPTGNVNTFAVQFYPYGFSNFVKMPIEKLANKETPLVKLFEEKEALELGQKIIEAKDTEQRIEIVEAFLISKLNEPSIIDNIVGNTIDALFQTKGSASISSILKKDKSKRRQLERNFLKQVGVSPKQLGRVIRLQTALKILLNQEESDTLTNVAYESKYYDQAHFIKDFKEFTGTTPKRFLGDESLILSSLFYK